MSIAAEQRYSTTSIESGDTVYQRRGFEGDLFTARAYKRWMLHQLSRQRNVQVTDLGQTMVTNVGSTTSQDIEGAEEAEMLDTFAMDPGSPRTESSTTTEDVSSPEVALESTIEGMDHLIRQAIEFELEEPQVATRAFHEYSKPLDVRLPSHIANRGLTPDDNDAFGSQDPRLAQSVGETPEFQRPLILSDRNIIFLGASVYELKMSKSQIGIKAGYPYLTYDAGEVIINQLSRNGRWVFAYNTLQIFDVFEEKGELWLARNNDEESQPTGWIWNKHFVKLAS